MNSTRHHQQCLRALTKAVVWYSLYCNSMFTDLRHRPRERTQAAWNSRKAHGAIKRLSPETMQKIANGYLFLDWFAIPQKLGIFFRNNPWESVPGSFPEWWAWSPGGFHPNDWGDFLVISRKRIIDIEAYSWELAWNSFLCFHQGNWIWKNLCSRHNDLCYSLLDTTIFLCQQHQWADCFCCSPSNFVASHPTPPNVPSSEIRV